MPVSAPATNGVLRLSDLPSSREPAARVIDGWVFDLDNTLYSASTNLFQSIHQRMGLFIEEHLGLDADAAYKLQKSHFARYGTTMRGLMEENGVDPVAYMDYVHRVDLSSLAPDPALDAALEQLPGRKVIFTNGSVAHAERIVRHLGIDRHFRGVFDIAEAGWVPKPDPAAYSVLLQRHGLSAERTAMVEDMAKNLLPASQLGMMTVWLRPDPARTELAWAREGSDGGHIDHVTDDLPAWLAAWTRASRGKS